MEDEDDMEDNDSSETLPIEPTSPILAGMSATVTGPFRNEQNDTLLPTKISKVNIFRHIFLVFVSVRLITTVVTFSLIFLRFTETYRGFAYH